MKKKTLLFLSLCALLSSSQLVQADTIDAPSSHVSSTAMANTGGQLSVVEEAGQMKAILSQITGEIIGITAQFSSETSVGYPLTFSIDEYGRYVAILDRTNFSQDDRDFTLKLTAQLTDGSSQQLTDYSFKWEVEKHDVASTPTSSGGSQAASTNIRAKAVSAVASHSTTSATSRTESSLSASSNVSQTQVSTGSTIASQPTGTITVENRNDAQGTFDVRITNVSSQQGISKVLVPTWTETNGQDDIIYHTADRQPDGSYLLKVNKSQHKNGTGKYNVHLYYRGFDGSMTYVAQTTTSLSEVSTTGNLSIANVNHQTGSFDVRITNVSSQQGISKVLVPTWTETNGQDDIIYHTADRQPDGSYLLKVNKSQHKNGTGKYNVHLYYRGFDGSMTYVNATTVDLPSAPRSYTVYLDPGHGGRDSGASYGGIHEKNLAMSVANKLKDSLVQRGINVLMTRTGDYDVDYRTERSSLVNKSNADLFISLHFNATGAGVTDTKGIETYWYKYDPEYQPKINKEKHNDPTRLAESEILANKVQASLIKETGAVNRGVKRETFAVLRETAVPAILVELGFMDNPSELQVIKQDSYHTRLARALTEGVMAWYGAVGGKAIGTESLPISDMQKGFIDVLIPAIKQTSKVHSILPSVMLAQAILESAWGTSHLATNGNNLFGIKADETWTGDTIEIVTNEYRNRELKQEKQLFRKYNSWKESIADYGKFFTSTPWRTKNYQGYREATDYQQAIVALRQSGYATDPRYGEKLRSVIESYKLYRLDN